MVVRTKEELDARIADGWGLSKKKGRYWYLQKRDPETGRILTEKVDDSLRDYCEELYYMRKLQRLGVRVDKSSSGSTSSRTEIALEKAVSQKIVQHAIKHIDKRTKKLLEWGEWVDNHITTLVPGDTWEEKAEGVLQLLDEMFKVYVEYEEIAGELQKLRTENQILNEMIRELKKKLEPVTQLRQLIIDLAKAGNTELVEKLVNKYIALTIKLQEV